MKKFLYLLLTIPALGLLSACDNDDNVPQVSIQVDYEGAVEVGGTLYVVQDEPFSITAVTVTPDQGTGNALIGPISYAWNYVYAGTSEFAPYGMTFDTSVMNPGNHILQITGTIAQVNKPLVTLNLAYRVKVVASVEDIPGYSDNATNSGALVKAVDTAD